jgi:hypothetical protein
MYLDSRFDLSILPPGAPVESASHQRLAGRPRESSSSSASLTLILRIGERDGMKLDDCQFWLADGLGDGGAGWLDVGVLPPRADPIEPRCDLGSDDCGVSSTVPLVTEFVDSRLAGIGRNRSRVRSRISDPIAPMAAPYRSRRILDSLTKNSANNRTRSASFGAVASFRAKAAKRSMVPRANCSVL